MSELKVDKISALGTGVNVNNPVGIRTAAPTAAGDALYVNGNTDVYGSVEVVTVQAENYGVRIKAPANNTNSILQFTNNTGTQRAFVSADASNNLILGSGTQNRVTINGASGLLSALYASDFAGDANFRSAANFAGNSVFNGQATFNNTSPSCSILPTLGRHLVNLDYLNSSASKVYVFGNNESTQNSKVHTQNIAAGTYIMVAFVGYQQNADTGGVWTAYLNLNISGVSLNRSHTLATSTEWRKTGGGGHGRSFAGSQMAISDTIVVSQPTTVTITMQKYSTAYDSSISCSYIALLIKQS